MQNDKPFKSSMERTGILTSIEPLIATVKTHIIVKGTKTIYIQLLKHLFKTFVFNIEFILHSLLVKHFPLISKMLQVTFGRDLK